jgi:ferredoxin-type protein NapH
MKQEWKNHLTKRILFFVSGMFLFAAPFALVMTGMGYVFRTFAPHIGTGTYLTEATIHRAMCLRMPLSWALWDQTTLIGRVLGNPLYLLVFFLIGIAFFAGPLFCGWLCPGGMAEHLGRLVPSRFKIKLKGKIDPAPIRYGFLAGFFIVAAPFIKKSICCSYCNWTWIENMWTPLFGNFEGITGSGMFAYTSSGIITFMLTFVILGVFLEGGRGWCNFLCPAGALQNLAHWAGAKLPFTYKLRFSSDKCTDCNMCVKACPTWAITPSENSVAINRHICNGCMDCVKKCHSGSLEYSRGE